MPLTVTQTKVLASHFSALRYSLTPRQEKDGPPEFGANDVIGSMILELGPHLSPLLSEAIIAEKDILKKLDPKIHDTICETIDNIEDELQDCIDADIPPSRRFREIIAALLEQLMPMLIQIVIGFLLEPDTKPPERFACRTN